MDETRRRRRSSRPPSAVEHMVGTMAGPHSIFFQKQVYIFGTVGDSNYGTIGCGMQLEHFVMAAALITKSTFFGVFTIKSML
jgi:hypothetical protein